MRYPSIFWRPERHFNRQEFSTASSRVDEHAGNRRSSCGPRVLKDVFTALLFSTGSCMNAAKYRLRYGVYARYCAKPCWLVAPIRHKRTLGSLPIHAESSTAIV